MNNFINFLESVKSYDPSLIESISEAYDLLFETITEPMQHLKKSVNYVDSSTVAKLQPYIKYSGKSPQDVTSLIELVTREWSWFGEAINERWGDGSLELGDDYPYDIDYENIDIDGLIKFMNEEPRSFEHIVRFFQTNIDGNNTSQLMDYQKPLINKWFVHFSNNAVNIRMEGFRYGNSDIEKLALTDAGSIKGKNYGDYLFAYEIDDVMKHAYSNRGGSRNKFKYGDSVVVFIASGIKFYHHGDMEPQVVFDRKSPTGCFLVRKADPEREDERSDKWVIYGKKGTQLIPLASKEKFEDAMYWCETNYTQYKKYYNW